MTNSIFKIFTISNGNISEGAVVEKQSISGGQIEIDVVRVGQSGRGRKMSYISVVGVPEAVVEEPLPKVNPDGTPNLSALGSGRFGSVSRFAPKKERKVFYARLGTTRSGHPKLIAVDEPDVFDDSKIIVVFKTGFGYRGGNHHTGDRTGTDPETGKSTGFNEFPADQILAEGHIADGQAGRMAGGTQYIAVMPKDTVFRVCRTGRLYGAEGTHYYLWNGENLLFATWKERCLSDIF